MRRKSLNVCMKRIGCAAGICHIWEEEKTALFSVATLIGIIRKCPIYELLSEFAYKIHIPSLWADCENFFIYIFFFLLFCMREKSLTCLHETYRMCCQNMWYLRRRGGKMKKKKMLCFQKQQQCGWKLGYCQHARISRLFGAPCIPVSYSSSETVHVDQPPSSTSRWL